VWSEGEREIIIIIMSGVEDHGYNQELETDGGDGSCNGICIVVMVSVYRYACGHC
jgi:hypothetical protein